MLLIQANNKRRVFETTLAAFSRQDLPKLQKAILQPYRDFDINEYGAQHQLIEKIVQLDSGSTLGFVKDNYASLTGDREKLKYSLLNCLVALKSKESYNLFKELITTKLPEKGSSKLLRFELTDSLELTAAIFPELMKASSDTEFIKILPFVANRLLDSGLISKSTLAPFRENFYNLVRRKIERLIKEVPEYDYAASQYIDLLTAFNEPGAYRLLHGFLLMPGLSIKERAAIALVKCGQKVDAAQFETIAKDDYYRVLLYEDLQDFKKQKLFPSKYYTQRLFAQSDVYQAASDDNDPASVIFIGEKTTLFMGKQKRFYLFKVTYNYDEGESESYLGIAGPYALQSSTVTVRSEVAGLYQDKEYDAAKVNAQLKNYLKQVEEYQKQESD